MQSVAARIIALVLISIALPAVPRAEAAGAVVAKCLPKFNAVKSSGRHWKAFAANEPNKNGQSCGWTEGFPAKDTAISKAMSECRASERKHPTWGVTGTCRIVLVK